MAGALVTSVQAADLPRFRPAPQKLTAGNETEAAEALQQLRTLGINGDYWLEFELRVMPRKGDERTLRGQIQGTRNERGPLTRLSIGAERWLIQSGSQPKAWTVSGQGSTVRELSAGDSLQPIAGTDLTVFDLQMPFLFWNDYAYEGLAKIRGRPAYSFLLYPPAELAAQRPELTGVRVALDTQFHALVQAELLGAEGKPLKAITVLDIKKIGEQWILKALDLRNQTTRDKTRLEFLAAALGLTLPAEMFTPAALVNDAALPVGTKLDRL